MEIIEQHENPQSTWGHHLRQNILNGLLRRGVTMDIIGAEDPFQEGLPMVQNTPLPDNEVVDEGKRRRSATPEILPEDMVKYPKIFLEGMNAKKSPSLCKLCLRILNSITAHHVHPRVNGQRRAPTGATATEVDLGETVSLCRPCHTIIHMVIPNEVMSNAYYTLEQLKSHPRVQAWVSWVRRQRIPSPWSFRQPMRTRRTLEPTRKSKRIQLKLKEMGNTKNGHGKLTPDSDLAVRIEGALAKLWSDSGNAIPRSLVDQPALQQRLSELTGGSLIRLRKIRRAMARHPEYRVWYEWTFPGAPALRSREAVSRRSRLEVELEKPRTNTESTPILSVGDTSKKAHLYPKATHYEHGSHNTSEAEKAGKHDGIGVHNAAGTGKGSRDDPIVFDPSDDEGGVADPGRRGGVTGLPSQRVIIDLTKDDDDALVIDQLQRTKGGAETRPGVFFDLGGNHVQSGEFLNP